MRGSFDVYSEHALNLIETREGHGTLLLTASLRTLFCDSRAHKLCGEIQHGKGQDDTDTLSVALVKVCEEIKDLVPLRNHSKDWEEFAVKRVIRGRGCQIFVCGIGLLAGLVDEEPGILLTLDHIGVRAKPPLQQRMTQFNLTRREAMVVEKLLKGSTNKEIANELNIAAQTAKEHLKHIMQKTKTTTRTAILSALTGLDLLSPR
ncbi:MAG TPA: LuxR C-terminal-related transcriptional regulator [Nitrospirales bacterium]